LEIEGTRTFSWDYYKPAEADTAIHSTSNLPIEYKEAAFTYMIRRTNKYKSHQRRNKRNVREPK
jgi:hypothetical protein